MNPFNPYTGGRPARSDEFGFNHSHRIPELKLNTKESLLKVDLAEIMPGGFAGMATLHITATDVTTTSLVEGQIANGRIQAEVTWQDGNGGGIEFWDLTRGHIGVVGGFTALNILCQWVPVDPTLPLLIETTKRLECNVHWYTSANPKAARECSPQVTLVAPGTLTSQWIPIPLGARDMIAQTDTPAAEAALIAEFSPSNGVVGAASIKQRTLDPVHNGSLIGSGVEFVRFVATASVKVIAYWDLWT